MARHNRFKVQAFFAEFPFLERLFQERLVVAMGYDNAEVEEVYVKRVDTNFLDKIPLYEGATGSLVGIEDAESIFLLNSQGDFLDVVHSAKSIVHNEAYLDNEEEEGESVGETLTHFRDPDVVAYAVCIHVGFKVRDHRSVGGYSVTLYKPPKGFSLRGWVEEQQRRAEQMLAAEVAEIDAEATA
ncbi:hypothetical protein IH982_01015 [Patescibacteria group bacterium]|nr:hypothetical protein [Patescibacteria group bacterium]